MDKQYNIEDEIEIINEIINCAVDHGGDNGGAYFSCGESLCEAIEEWLVYRNIHEEYVVKGRLTCDYDSDYIIVKKEKRDPEMLYGFA